MAIQQFKDAEDAYRRSLEILIQLHGTEHGTVGLAYLCMARLPNSSPPVKKDFYEKCLRILDIPSSQLDAKRGQGWLPEVPSVQHFERLVAQIKKESAQVVAVTS